VLAGNATGALALADALGVVLEAAQERAAQTGLVGAAVGRRDGVAIGGEKTVGVGGPGHCPLGGAMAPGLARAAGEDIKGNEGGVAELGTEIVAQACGEMERGLLRYILDAAQKLLGARPPDLDAAKQVSLRARHLEDALRLEMRLRAEDLRVGAEAHPGAAPV